VHVLPFLAHVQHSDAKPVQKKDMTTYETFRFDIRRTAYDWRKRRICAIQPGSWHSRRVWPLLRFE
jgi:hypothetical protein